MNLTIDQLINSRIKKVLRHILPIHVIEYKKFDLKENLFISKYFT